MAEEIEISSLDLRYEGRRMKNPALEGRLLAAIAERGIEEPLEGVEVAGQRVLLNGFKRLRCARRLGLQLVPYASLGEDAAQAIINLLRISNNKSLSILEQAGFVDELKAMHGLSLAEIAAALSRSKAWVSVRLGLIGQMTARVREILFRGDFPVYAYMYGLRPFMRINGVAKKLIEEFIVAVSGRNLSVREIELLAQAFFRGPPSLRAEIRAGHVALSLDRARRAEAEAAGCGQFERSMLNDLQIAGKYMERVILKNEPRRLRSPSFHVRAQLLAAGLLQRGDEFLKTVRQIHDRSGAASGDPPTAAGGDEPAGDRAALGDQSQHGAGHRRPCGAGAGGGATGQNPA
jgi:hypothetical protein